MFNLSGSEIVIILLLALVVLGPEKLPDAIRRFGRMYGELKRMSNSFQDEMRATLDEPMREMRETADLLRQQASEMSDLDPDGQSAADAGDHGYKVDEPADGDDGDAADDPGDDGVDSDGGTDRPDEQTGNGTGEADSRPGEPDQRDANGPNDDDPARDDPGEGMAGKDAPT